jgi:hypothetical protein
MKIYLRVYKLERMISPYVDMLQRTVCKWNHCSIRIEDTIIHFFDPDVLPRWTSTAADERLYKTYHDIYIGDCNLEDVRNFTNKFLQFSWYDGLCRHLWYYTMGLWPKRRDCVDKCSATLTYLFKIPRCYSTPDKLVELVHEYNRNKGIR